jgi:glycosyltransferase involved in cell wall biosynthesis
MTSVMKPSKLGEMDDVYGTEEIPLSKHMVYTWHRFDMKGRFHLNSNKSRLDYIVWYLLEFMPGRHFDLPPIDARVHAALMRTIPAWGPMSLLVHEIWRQRYSGDQAYNIHQEAGYHRFVTTLMLQHEQMRVLLPFVPNGMLKAGLQPVLGRNGQEVSRAAFALREASEIYRVKYHDLNIPEVRDAYNFDLIVHSYLRDGNIFLLSPETITYWASAPSTADLRLSRFMIALALLSGRFRGKLTSETAIYAMADAIVEWIVDEVLPRFSRISRFLPNSVMPKKERDNVSESRQLLATKYGVSVYPGDSIKTIDLLVIGPYSAASGLGSGMRRSVEALKEAGVDFRILNVMYDNPSASIEAIDEALAFKGESARTTLWHYNAEYLPEVVTVLQEFINKSYNIGYFFWETEAMPAAHRLGCEMVDEIWAPSEFVKRCYELSGKPVFNVGTAVSIPVRQFSYDRAAFGMDDQFVFLFSFDAHSVIHRKNPAAVVRAFQQAFPFGRNDVMLIIKTQNFNQAHWGIIGGRNEELAELCALDSRIKFFDKTMSLDELYSLKAACDCYVSLHRSEGFGYGPAEAMALGKPVIMSNYSANVEFGSDDAALLVDGRLVHVLEGEYLYRTPEMVWFDPDVGHAAACMRRVRDDVAFRKALGLRGQRRIETDFSTRAMAARYSERLAKLGIGVPGDSNKAES